MKKTESLSGAPVARVSLSTINRNIAAEQVEDLDGSEGSLSARLVHVISVFNAIRPLLVVAATVPFLQPATRSAVSVFVQSLDALSILALPGDEDEVADFKAGRDL